MKRLILALCLGLLTSTSTAADHKDVILPVNPLPPSVMPSTATKLSYGSRYVVRSKVECEVISFPEDLISWEFKKGPRDWTGVFVGGKGFEEDRRFDEPFLYSAKALKSGKVTVYIIPSGTKKDNWIKVDLEVDATDPCEKKKVDPTPPTPNPPVPDPPTPPKPPVLGKQFVVVLVDRLNNDPVTAGIIGSKAYREYLKASDYEMEVIDIQSETGKTKYEGYKKVLDNWKVNPPAFVLMDAEGSSAGLVRLVKPMPKTDKELIDAIKAITGK